MRVRGLTFVGTSTDARERMAALVRDVFGLPSVPVEARGMSSSPSLTGRPSRLAPPTVWVETVGSSVSLSTTWT
jgi:hypothetical protein